METKDAICALKLLKEKVQKYDLARLELEQAAEKLRKAEARKPAAVRSFDRDHKQDYIISHIGEEPVKPKGLIKLAIPVYRAKKRAYEKEYAEYKEKYDKCVAAYYREYAEKRSKLESEECAEIENNIKVAKQIFETTQEQYRISKQELVSDTTVSEKLKKVEVVDTLIAYFQDHRADCLKEAINLYYEEEHRRRVEDFAQEQVRLTAEAAELARQAAESAEEAAESAEEAISQAESALERANEAYEKAEEAYSEAQNAYWAATSKDD